ncbi:MAG: arginyltransferase [Gammaproteobacteria bacterium]|nr:arginyltransferase [Gammaproteobacteria bacterium]
MDHQRIKLYQGSESECSYLADRVAVNIYADPHHPHPDAVYNQLIGRGFRRSGEYVYRPGCNNCNACVPVRLIADEFEYRRIDRRNLKRNQDLEVSLVPARLTNEYFELYQRYLAQRHPAGGMDNPEPEDFERFLLNPWGETVFVDIRDGERCIAIAVTDATPGGLSAVYTFFDPDESARSLGRFSILQQLALCQRMAIPYLYLGYWVEGSRKMRYKIDYLPQEHYNGSRWERIERGENQEADSSDEPDACSIPRK